MNANKFKTFGLVTVIIVALSAAISYSHFPPLAYGYEKWAFSAASIASGLLFFLIVSSDQSEFGQALPGLLVAIAIPAGLFFLYFKRGHRWALMVGSVIWVAEGYASTIGAWF